MRASNCFLDRATVGQMGARQTLIDAFADASFAAIAEDLCVPAIRAREPWIQT